MCQIEENFANDDNVKEYLIESGADERTRTFFLIMGTPDDK